jgi:hypothetical protein
MIMVFTFRRVPALMAVATVAALLSSGIANAAPGPQHAAGARPQYTATPPSAAPIYLGVSGKCLDDRGNGRADGTRVQVWNCTRGDAQQWTLRAYPGRAYMEIVINGHCLDVTNKGTTNGSKLQLWDCFGTPNQWWLPQPNGTILNPESGKVIDDTAFSTSNGTQVQIWTPTGASNQVWRPFSNSTWIALATVQNWPESGNHGYWALGDFKRLVTVTKQFEVPVSDCGLAADACYQYTATLWDVGTFTTSPNTVINDGTPATSPQAGTPMPYGFSGGLYGGADNIVFDASASVPSDVAVNGINGATITIAAGTLPAVSTTDWVTQFFAPGTSFGTVDLGGWDWQYRAYPPCTEAWIDASDNGQGSLPADGDITTVAC